MRHTPNSMHSSGLDEVTTTSSHSKWFFAIWIAAQPTLEDPPRINSLDCSLRLRAPSAWYAVCDTIGIAAASTVEILEGTLVRLVDGQTTYSAKDPEPNTVSPNTISPTSRNRTLSPFPLATTVPTKSNPGQTDGELDHGRMCI